MTRSIGTGTPGFSIRAAAVLARTAFTSAALVGPRFVPPDAEASYPAGPAADGRERKYPGEENGWPMMREPTRRPSL